MMKWWTGEIPIEIYSVKTQVHEPLAYFEKGQQWTYLEGVPSTESLCVKLLNEEKEKYGFVITDDEIVRLSK